MATIYRYRASSPTVAKLRPYLTPGAVIAVGPPSVDTFVDVDTDVDPLELVDAMSVYDFEYVATAPPGIVALPAAYEPLVEVQAAPVAGRVLQIDWYQSYPPGGPPVGLARRRVDTWSGPRLIGTTVTDYWIDGTPIVVRTYDYETTATGDRIERES
jgi:hypothetical protein